MALVVVALPLSSKLVAEPATPAEAGTGQTSPAPVWSAPSQVSPSQMPPNEMPSQNGFTASDNTLPTDLATETGAGSEPIARPDPDMPGGVAVDREALPHDLSPWGMFLVADIVVKAVMIGLVIASVVTWTVWLAKSLELAAARTRTRKALALIDGQRSLGEAAARLGKQRGVVSAFVEAARDELRLSNGSADKEGIKERVESRLDGLRTAAARQMNAGTGLLATIGSTAPFVGLFGTVWGIMNSFIGISEAQTTNLAVVAPGIAEALLATALGLAAAIPAVIIYNYFSRSIAGYRALITDAAAEVMRQLSRELDAKPTITQRSVQAAAE